MAAGDSINVIGNDYTESDWGIPDEQLGFIATTSVSVSNAVESVEAKNRVGEVVAVVLYNKSAEVTVEGIGQPDSGEVGSDATLTGIDDYIQAGSTKIIITGVDFELSNEDWARATVKGNVYELIS